MTFNAIKLNPSQELALLKARDALLGSGGALSMDKKSGLVLQPIGPDQPIFLRPLLCVMPDDFGKEDFLSIKKFEIFHPLKANLNKNEPLCFWAKIIAGDKTFAAPIPFALPYSFSKDFSLEKIFELTKTLTNKEEGAEAFFLPTSFKFCQVQTTKNEWRLDKDIWKNL